MFPFDYISWGVFSPYPLIRFSFGYTITFSWAGYPEKNVMVPLDQGFGIPVSPVRRVKWFSYMVLPHVLDT